MLSPIDITTYEAANDIDPLTTKNYNDDTKWSVHLENGLKFIPQRNDILISGGNLADQWRLDQLVGYVMFYLE